MPARHLLERQDGEREQYFGGNEAPHRAMVAPLSSSFPRQRESGMAPAMELFVPSASDLAGWAGVAFAALAFLGLGRLMAGGKAAPEAALVAGWGAASFVLTLWGVATPASMRPLAAALAALGIMALLVPRSRLSAQRVARARAHRAHRAAVLRHRRERAAERARHVFEYPAERRLSLRPRLLPRRGPAARSVISAGGALQSADRGLYRGPGHAGLSRERAHRLQFRARAGDGALPRAARRRERGRRWRAVMGRGFARSLACERAQSRLRAALRHRGLWRAARSGGTRISPPGSPRARRGRAATDRQWRCSPARSRRSWR